MINTKKQQKDFRFTQQGSKHDKDKIAFRFLKKLINSSNLLFTSMLNHRTKRSTSKKLAKERCSDQTTKGKKKLLQETKGL